jgi:hypothetical protein
MRGEGKSSRRKKWWEEIGKGKEEEERVGRNMEATGGERSVRRNRKERVGGRYGEKK